MEKAQENKVWIKGDSLSNQSLQLFYTPVPNESAGEKIAKQLIEKKLIACANIFPSHKAVYQWQNQLQIESENIMILKTTKDLCKQVEQIIAEIHPYETPCIIQLSPTGCNPEFLHWVQSSLSFPDKL